MGGIFSPFRSPLAMPAYSYGSGEEDIDADPIPPSVRAILDPNTPGLPPPPRAATPSSIDQPIGSYARSLGMIESEPIGTAPTEPAPLRPETPDLPLGAIIDYGVPLLKRAGSGILSAARFMAGDDAIAAAPPPPTGPREPGPVNPIDQRTMSGTLFADSGGGDMGGRGVVRTADSPTMAAPAKATPSIRAVRMPDGRLVYTNVRQDEGTEVDYDRATAETRSQIQGGRTPIDPSDLSSRTMTALSRAAERAGTRGAGSGRPGGVSVVEGTPEQQQELAIERAMGAVSLATLGQQRELASMPVGQRAMLENRDIQTAAWITNQFQPQLARANAKADEKIKIIRATIADPRAQAIAVQETEQQRLQELQSLQAQMAMVMGIRPGGI